MANKTDALALRAHGTDPQFLIEKITREKIYGSRFWKEECFGLDTSGLVEKAAKLQYCCGLYGTFRVPSPFLCLALKMLQLSPDKDVVVEIIAQDEFKYLRVLGAFYLRLVGTGVDVYRNLEPLYEDFRKIRVRSYDGFTVEHVDEVVERLLWDEDLFDTKLPRLPDRSVLAQTRQLAKRVSPLAAEIEELARLEEKTGEETETAQNGSPEADKVGTAPAAEKTSGHRDSDRPDAPVRPPPPPRRPPPPPGREGADEGEATAEEPGDGSAARRDGADSGRRSERRLDSRGDSRSGRDRSDRHRSSRDHRDDHERRRHASPGRYRRDHRRSSRRSRSRSLSRSRSRSRGRSRRYRSRSRGRSRSPARRSRGRSRSPARRHRSRSRDRKGGEASKRRDETRPPARGGKGSREPTETRAPSEAKPAEGSVEYWNEQRAKLGLKPLK